MANLGLFLKIVYLFTALALLLGGATCAYYLSKTFHSWGLKTGISPAKKYANISVNILFFSNYALVAISIIEFLMAICELLLLFNVAAVAKFTNNGVVRGIIYVFLGICLLGVCADLGIAAGSIQIAAGALTIVFGFVQLFK